MADNETFDRLANLLNRENENLDLLEKEVNKGSFDFNTTDEKGYTLLHISTKRNNPEAIKIILKSKSVNPNLTNQDGYSPIMDACRLGKGKALEELLKFDSIILEAVDVEHNNIKDLLDASKVISEDTKNMMINMIEKKKKKKQGFS